MRQIRRILLTWGKTHGQTFAWRSETNPWLTLVAELLLQRTRAAQVEPVFLDLQKRYPDASMLHAAGPEAARELTARLGIHWRAPLLYELAGIVTANGGVPPTDLARLRAIRGVGPYTAAAWLSLHQNTRAVIVDSNVARWLARLTGQPYPSDPRHVRWVNDLAERLPPRRVFRAWNYAVLDFTMTVCLPRTPRCPECPLVRHCVEGRRRTGREQHPS